MLPNNETKILLVEDHEPVRDSLTFLLEELGYKVQTAVNGKIGWKLIPDFKPDVILTDLKMPIMSGMKLLEKVTENNLQIPVIIFSGQGSSEETIKALQMGAYDYLKKPLTDTNFISHSIDKAIEKQNLINLATNYQELFEKGLKEKTLELKLKIDLLQEAEQRFLKATHEWENTFNSIQETVALYDHDHNLIRFNKSFANLFSGHLDETSERKVCLFTQNCSNDKDCPHHRVFKTNIAETVIHEDTLSNKFFETQILPYITDNKPNGTILVARDITDIKTAQDEQKRLQIRLLQAQKLESVGQLAAGIAHEINTPTQYVSSNLEFLNDAYQEINELLDNISQIVADGTDERSTAIKKAIKETDLEYLRDEVPSSINQSREGTNRIRSIVSAMKEFSHPGSKEKESANINKIINTTITVARNEWKYVSTVTTHLDPELPFIECLTDEIGQVILNLLVNSAQAIGEKLGTTPTGDKGTIVISTSHNDDQIIITIEDSGSGIPEEIINKIFDPFFTTKDVGKGTGQGLAIAHDVIHEKHNGSLEVCSDEGKGTLFVIKLPIKQP